MFKYILFDLDETLYPRQAGLMQELGARIHLYLQNHLHLSEAEAIFLRQRYFMEYGTALRGLIVERHDADPEIYLKFVHDIQLSKYIGPNPELGAMLRSIDLPKIIFTNSTLEHSQNVLKILGIADCFERIVDIRSIDYISKPNQHAYEKILSLINVQASECILVEDSARNLRPAKALGMKTILVDSDDCADVDYCVKNILEVKSAVDKALVLQ